MFTDGGCLNYESTTCSPHAVPATVAKDGENGGDTDAEVRPDNPERHKDDSPEASNDNSMFEGVETASRIRCTEGSRQEQAEYRLNCVQERPREDGERDNPRKSVVEVRRLIVDVRAITRF